MDLTSDTPASHHRPTGTRAVQHKHLRFGNGFRVVLGDDHSQAAQMTLGPGETEGGPDNRHRGADQWLFVVSGEGMAVVKQRADRAADGDTSPDQAGRDARDPQYRTRAPPHAQFLRAASVFDKRQ